MKLLSFCLCATLENLNVNIKKSNKSLAKENDATNERQEDTKLITKKYARGCGI